MSVYIPAMTRFKKIIPISDKGRPYIDDKLLHSV